MFIFLEKIKNQRGASMLQMLMIGAAVYVMGAAVFKLTTQESKQSQSLLGNIQLKSFVQGVEDSLANPDVCIATLNQDGALTAGKSLNRGVINASDQDVYKVSIDGDATYNGRVEIQSVTLDGYTAESGIVIKQFQLKITTKPFYTGKSSKASFSNYTKNSFIPVWAVLEDNKVLNCFSGDDAGVTLSLFINTCSDFGGVFDVSSGKCVGASEKLKERVRFGLCAPSDSDSCEHPNKGEECSGKDIKGVDYNNWVISGFDGTGKINCSCVPVPCPNPLDHCYGKDLGTDHCQRNCGSGLNSGFGCCPYGPAENTVCKGVSYKKYDSCGLRPAIDAVGTKDGGSCVTTTAPPEDVPDFVPSDPPPDCGEFVPAGSANDFCQGTPIIQTRANCPGEQRVILGTNPGKCTKKPDDPTPTKDPEPETCKPGQWIPSASSECSGVEFEQFNGCEKRRVTGTKTSGVCVKEKLVWRRIGGHMGGVVSYSYKGGCETAQALTPCSLIVNNTCNSKGQKTTCKVSDPCQCQAGGRGSKPICSGYRVECRE